MVSWSPGMAEIIYDYNVYITYILTLAIARSSKTM